MALKEAPPLTLRAVGAVRWSALEIVARYGVQFVVMLVLARLLQPADFGLLAMLLVFIVFAALLVEGGLGSALVQKQQVSASDETSAFVINVAAGCILAASFWFFSPAIARFYGQPNLEPLLKVLLWTLPLGALAAVPNALLSRRLDFRRRALAELLASAGSALLAVWLAWQGNGVWSLVWQIVAGAALRAVLLWLLSGWRPRGRFSWRTFSGLFRFSGFLLFANALNVLSVQFQSLLIGRLFDSRALGFYVMAQDTQQAPAQFMSSLLNRVGLPVFSTVAEQPGKLVGALRLSLRLSMFVFAPGMVCIAIASKPLMVALYGPAWEGSAQILTILAVAGVFYPLHVLNLLAISARGRTDIVFRLEIIKVAISIPLIFSASTVSVTAVAYAVLASSLASVGVNTFYSRQLLGYGLAKQLRDLSPTIALSLLATGFALGAKALAEGVWTQLTVTVVSMMGTYILCALGLRLPEWFEFVAFLRTGIGERQKKRVEGGA